MNRQPAISFPLYRDLLSAVLAGESVPNSPVAFWQHHPIADQERATLVEATLAFQGRFDCDLVKITPASTFQTRDYGLGDAWQDDLLGRRAIGPGIIREPDDWLALPRLDPGKGFVSRHLHCAEEVRHRLPSDVPVLQSVFNPIFQAAILAGERFAEHLEQYPARVEAGLATIAANTLDFIDALKGTRVDGIYLVSQHARAGALSVDDYRRFGIPYDKACLERAIGLPFNMLHLHGAHIHAHLVRDYPVQFIHYAPEPGNPAPESLLAECSTAISSGPAQFGAIQRGTVAEAAAEAEEFLNRLKGPRFLLGAGCVLPLDTPEQNIHAAMAAARTPRPDRMMRSAAS